MILYSLLTGIGFRPFMRAVYRMDIAGADRVPASGPGILVANHESIVDPYVLGVVTRRPIHYMAKAELWSNPVGRALMRGFGAFPVVRGTGDGVALTAAGRLLERGELLGIFPEGTCLPYRRRPYMRGAARLALATGSPLVPVCLVGTERLLRPHRLKVGLPKLRILVSRPVEVERQRPTLVAARALTERVRETIEELRRPYGPPAHAWMEDA